jgi:hypothetical protein
MLKPAVRVGREIGVLAVDVLRPYMLWKLRQKTVLADLYVQWIKRLELL